VSNQLGAIFDFDGVIFHSERQHEIAWERVAQEDHRPFSHEAFLLGFGLKNDRFIQDVVKWSQDPKEIDQIIQRKEAHFQSLLDTQGPLPIPGTILLIQALVTAGVPCAIGSSSVKKNIDLVLEKYPLLQRSFSALVTAEDVRLGKPHPDVFLTAAKKLDIGPQYCVVFEDAPAGIQAAKSAGMKAVALTTTFPVAELKKVHPDRLVDSLSSLSVQDLMQLIKE
jgi:beta-phosphoglucomutase-like phosphatase (HAD superfamily)